MILNVSAGVRHTSFSHSNSIALHLCSTIISGISRDWGDKQLQSWGHNMPFWWGMSERVARLTQLNKYASETSRQWCAKKGSLNYTCQTLKWMGSSSRRPNRPLVLSVNKNGVKRSTWCSALDSRLEWCGTVSLWLHTDERVRNWHKQHKRFQPSCCQRHRLLVG